jgi:hypothetical protein
MRRVGAKWAGFSLLEALFMLVLLAFLSGGVFTLLFSREFGATLSGDECGAAADVQQVLRDIGTDFAGASTFQAPTYSGGARVSLASGQVIEYYQNGSDLKRLVTSPQSATTTAATRLVSGTGFSLIYFDSAMNAITSPMTSTLYAQAAAVQVTVTISLPHAAFRNVTRSSLVVLRNRTS